MKYFSLFIILTPFVFSSCLKTRAQLRGEGPDTLEEHEAVAVRPAESVKPEGHYVIEEIKSEITQLTGRIEDLERAQKERHKAEKGEENDSKQDQERIAHLETKLEELSQKLDHLELAKASPADSKDLFDKAKALYEQQNYTAAAETFSTYLKIPKGKHQEEATFLRGESYFKLKKFKNAIVDYSRFPEKYSKSKKVPEALYRIGLSFEALGMKDDAKGFFQELVEKYPKSAEASKVRKKIQ